MRLIDLEKLEANLLMAEEILAEMRPQLKALHELVEKYYNLKKNIYPKE